MCQFNEPKQEERNWAMWCHLSSLAWLLLILLGIPIPFIIANIVGPLICWLLKKDESAFINTHGKESLNFQISMTIYGIVLTIIIISVIAFLLLLGIFTVETGNPFGLIITGLSFVSLITMGIAFGVLQLALAIYAGIKAREGLMYRYPFTLRFL